MENLVINRGNPRRVEIAVLGANGAQVELSRCTEVELVLWVNGRSKRAQSVQVANDILIAELSASELDYLGEYSAQVKYTDNGIRSASERVYLFRVANEFFRTASNLSDNGNIAITVTTPQALNKGYSAYELAVQGGFVGTEEEWIASLSQESKDAAAVALSSAAKADKATSDSTVQTALAAKATLDANNATQSSINQTNIANIATSEANTARDKANTAADNANAKAVIAQNNANLANAAATTANSSAVNADAKASLAQTAADNANNAATNANNATTNANNAATNANAKAIIAQQAADSAKAQGDYAKAQGDYAKSEAQGIDAKIATKANQSDLDKVKPSNAGTTGQVLTKTSTGQEWRDSSGGIYNHFGLTVDLREAQLGNIFTNRTNETWSSIENNPHKYIGYDAAYKTSDDFKLYKNNTIKGIMLLNENKQVTYIVATMPSLEVCEIYGVKLNSYNFTGCNNLRYLKVGLAGSSVTAPSTSVLNLPNTESIYLKNVDTYIPLDYCPVISIDSLTYLCNNRKGTNSINISIHANVYNSLTDDLVNLASSKNITFTKSAL